MQKEKRTFNPYPFIETIEDLQEVIYSFGCVYKSEDAIEDHATDPETYPEETALVRIKRILCCEYWGSVVVDNETFEEWLIGGFEEKEPIYYTLNYSEFADYITSDYLLSGYNGIPVLHELVEKARPNFKLFERKLRKAKFAEQEIRAFAQVIEGYFQQRDIVKGISSDFNFPSEKRIKDALNTFIDLTVNVIENRLLHLRLIYNDIKHPIASEKLEQLYMSNSAKMAERLERIKELLSKYLPEEFFKKFAGNGDTYILMLAQDPYTLKKYFHVKTSYLEKTQFHVLCHVLGIIDELVGKEVLRPLMPNILQSLYKADIETELSQHEVKDTFKRYYSKRRENDKKYNPLVSDSANITKVLLQKFPMDAANFTSNPFIKK